jgi:serine/threonine-protein kinase RsbW
MIELVVPSDLRAAREAEEQILRAIEQEGFASDAAFAIRLSLEEAITNAVKHGNRNDRSKHITLRCTIDKDKAIIHVADEGSGFDPKVVPDPTEPARISLPNGRGIMLIRAYMDEVRFNDHGNEVCMIKRRR